MAAKRHAAESEGPAERVGTSRERRSSARWNGPSNNLYLRFYGLKTLHTTHRTNVLPARLFNFGAMIMAIIDATELEITVQYEPQSCALRARKVVKEDDHLHATAASTYGWKRIILIGVCAKAPLTVTANDSSQAILGEERTGSC